MQCTNCQFENMPGIDHCGRCGGSLRLKTATIDVNPPRAKDRGAKLRSGGWAIRRWINRIQNAASPVGGLWDEVFSTSNTADLMDVNWMTIWVPGLPQWLSGKRLVARCLMPIYVISFIAGLVLWGSTPGAICWGVAFACHIITIIDVVFSLDTSSTARLSGTVMGISLLTIVALTLNGAVSRWVLDSRLMTITQAPLAPGDSLLLRPYWSAPNPQRGEVVLWMMPFVQINEPERHRITQYGGEQIDRVLAVSGDVVEFRPDQLLVNGQPAEFLPLNPAVLHRLPAAKITVPLGSCVIVASTNSNLGRVWSSNFESIAVVSHDVIRAKVLFRNYPLTRMGRIR